MQHKEHPDGKPGEKTQPGFRHGRDEKQRQTGSGKDGADDGIDHDPPGAAHAGSDARAEEDNNP